MMVVLVVLICVDKTLNIKAFRGLSPLLCSLSLHDAGFFFWGLR